MVCFCDKIVENVTLFVSVVYSLMPAERNIDDVMLSNLAGIELSLLRPLFLVVEKS